MNPKLSIITGTRNRPESYARFIESARSVATISTEIIVADATDETLYAMTERFQEIDVTVIYETPRLGPLRGYNTAFRQARGEYAAWFNDDCELLPGWDMTAINFMDANPQVGLGCIYFMDRHPNGQWKTRIHPRDVKRMALKEITNEEAERIPVWEVQSLYGMIYANFGILKRSLGEEIGWFDEGLGWMYGCDNDLCCEVVMRDLAVVPIPDCRVKHYRDQGDTRSDNYTRIRKDRRLFDHKWTTKMDEVREKMKKFAYLMPSSKYL